MILLDTNVLSELMLEHPNPLVADWLDRQPHTSVWTSTVTIFEIRSGLLRMPAGKRRSDRVANFESILAEIIERRIADFGMAAAEEAAAIFAEREKKGRPGELRDTMIAGIVLANHATLATRNVRHFEDIAKAVVNPWEA